MSTCKIGFLAAVSAYTDLASQLQKSMGNASEIICLG